MAKIRRDRAMASMKAEYEARLEKNKEKLAETEKELAECKKERGALTEELQSWVNGSKKKVDVNGVSDAGDDEDIESIIIEEIGGTEDEDEFEEDD